MQVGLNIRLNPSGGNQLNVRELLKLLSPPEKPTDDADLAGMEDGPNAAAAGATPNSGVQAAEPDPPGRRSALDDYDYDDDFIDDGELEDAPEDALTPVEMSDGEPYDENADGDFVPDKPLSDSDSDGNQVPGREAVMNASQQYHAFGRFFINRGDLPAKSKLKPVQSPPSKLGNVSVNHISLQPRPGSTPATGAPLPTEQAGQPSTPIAKNSQAGVVKKTAPNGVQPGVNTVKKKTGDATQPPVRVAVTKPTKVVPVSVQAEIIKLSKLCHELFGDKKPKLNDPKLQEQLHMVFKSAIKENVGRLFSDIAKDKRIISLADEVWLKLSRFLRTKRANLETLGHALHWNGREKDAKERVEKLELELSRDMAAQQPQAVNGQVVWTRALDEKMFAWYRARYDLQLAKNQLASRPKNIKKLVPIWVSNLKKVAFTAYTVSEQDITDAFRRIEEERHAKDRQKREADRLERKRKKEEQAAVVAAKRAAVANAKGASNGGTPSPAPVAEGQASGAPKSANKVTKITKMVKSVNRPALKQTKLTIKKVAKEDSRGPKAPIQARKIAPAKVNKPPLKPNTPTKPTTMKPDATPVKKVDPKPKTARPGEDNAAQAGAANENSAAGKAHAADVWKKSTPEATEDGRPHGHDGYEVIELD